MIKNKDKAFIIKKNILNKISSMIFNEKGSLDFLQILIFGFYILLGIQITRLNQKKDNTNIPNDFKNFNWAPKGNKIKTKWGINLDINNIWNEYPRPQLERKDWINLNGPWLYSITEEWSNKPSKADGIILIPFPIESSLSGVMKNITKEDIIWYEKDIEIPLNWSDKNILLNFGAVDWKCIIYINDIKVGEHTGGFSAFNFDITNYLRKGINKLIVKVIDPTNQGYQPRGKQVLNPKKIYYTAISGIWQTVWLEPVNKDYIQNLEINNDFDNKEIKINFKLNSQKRLPISLSLEYKGQNIKKVKGISNDNITINLENNDFHPWSTYEPNIYTIKAELFNEKNQLIDSIESYTTIRKIEQRKDENGYYRIYLNNKKIFNMGVLDQGYWPDGLYTPPSEEAMICDINKLKELGFNTIRKHVKIEPYRYYYYCDIIGMLIWQDMPSGDQGKNIRKQYKLDKGTDRRRSKASIETYYKEWGEIIDNLKFFQCIIIWIPFNEGWGQFDTEKVANFTIKKDSTRLLNVASGGNHRKGGNIFDLHHYPEPSQSMIYKDEINVIGEYGGLGLEIYNHTWKKNNWGYVKLKSKEEVTEKYVEFIDEIINLTKNGTSAAIYTQTTDVEIEINGLITYDRAEMKIDEEKIKEANFKLLQSFE